MVKNTAALFESRDEMKRRVRVLKDVLKEEKDEFESEWRSLMTELENDSATRKRMAKREAANTQRYSKPRQAIFTKKNQMLDEKQAEIRQKQGRSGGRGESGGYVCVRVYVGG